jgi:hypothetical protein
MAMGCSAVETLSARGVGRSRALGWPHWCQTDGQCPRAGRAAHCNRGQTSMGGAYVLVEGSGAGARHVVMTG